MDELKQELEALQARAEMRARKTRHHEQAQRRAMMIEIISGIACMILGIIVLFGFMLVFPD